MKNSGLVKGARIACLVSGIFIGGCELESSDSDESANADVSGTWLYTNTGAEHSSWALVQFSDDSVSGTGTSGETIGGYLSAENVYMTLHYTNSVVATLNGSVDDTTMMGTYTNSANVSGTWTAIRTDTE